MPNLLHSSRCPTGCEGGRNQFYLLPQGPSSQARRRCAQRHLAHDALLQRRPGQHPGARSGVPCTRPRGSARSASRSGTAGAGFSGSRPNDRVCSAPSRSASGRRTNRAIPRTTMVGRSGSRPGRDSLTVLPLPYRPACLGPRGAHVREPCVAHPARATATCSTPESSHREQAKQCDASEHRACQERRRCAISVPEKAGQHARK
jgi:hypothetical protein